MLSCMEVIPSATPAMPAAQLPSNIMAEGAAAAVGCTRIATNISMSIVDLIMVDHNCVRAMYDAYRAPAVSLEHKQLLAWNMIMALSSHAAKEEMVLYPVVRSTLGPVVADQLTNEHSTAKQLLATLDTMSATDPGFDMQLRASLDNIIAHMQEEESTVLPQLAAVLSAEAQLQLGIQFEASKVCAPTRPHPEAANLAPFNEVAFAAAKQVDVALDQARMPTLVPTQVSLSPLMTPAGAAAFEATAGTVLQHPVAAGADAIVNQPLPSMPDDGLQNEGMLLPLVPPAGDSTAVQGGVDHVLSEAAGLVGHLGPAGGELPGGDAGNASMEEAPGGEAGEADDAMEAVEGTLDVLGGGGTAASRKRPAQDLAPGSAPEDLPIVQ